MPNLGRYVEANGYARFQIANPAQSEVSWTSIASGVNPGQHGIFDFVHRHPKTYSLVVSLLPTRSGLGGSQFIRPSSTGTIFDQAAAQGFPATSLWWPATFPANPESPVRTVPGLGTPDIQGRLGVGRLFTSDPDQAGKMGRTPVDRLQPQGKDRYTQVVKGPVLQAGQGEKAAEAPFQLDIEPGEAAVLRMGDQSIALTPGVWSPIFEVKFKLGPFLHIWGVTRAILTSVHPAVTLYFLPIQLHPLKSPWRYASPGHFIKHIWRTGGPFLTIGWPQDTQALEDGILTDRQFLDLCRQITASRVQVLLHLLEHFQEGLLGFVEDTLDRVQHMFWKGHPEVIEGWYTRLDELVGRVEQAFAAHSAKNERLILVSDHGFAAFDTKVHLNRWLLDQGYLVSRDRAPADRLPGEWEDIDWDRTRAYAIGLNSLYLNLAGREGRGQVEPGQAELLLSDLESRLLSWTGSDGRHVVQEVWRRAAAFRGLLAQDGPDVVIGYAPGYRASAQTGLGGWDSLALEENGDHWSADHCIHPQAVPGVIFSSLDLMNYSSPSYQDIPSLTIGMPLDSQPPPSQGDPPSLTAEEEEIIQERLKSLGYF
jgi:predicted AlkP superfamily phosphohydrolase/phosphomutase